MRYGITPLRRAATVVRWMLGMVLISWRYLWQITPLHRHEEPGSADDMPPALPRHLVDERDQPAEAGYGPLFHRLFSVRVHDNALTSHDLIARLADDLTRVIPSEATAVQYVRGNRGRLDVGDEFVVRMPGPWDGPVRVVDRTDTSFRLATLTGHLEAGQIEFRARDQDDVLRFEIEAWARPGNRLVHLLYSRLRLAKEMQLNMWTRCCLSAAAVAQGHVPAGVSIHTRCVPRTTSPRPEAHRR